MRTAVLLVFLLPLGVWPDALVAQEGHAEGAALHRLPTSGPWPGQRVRITSGSARVVGTVVERSADSLLIRLDRRKRLLVVPIDRVDRAEVSRGRRSGATAGVIVGGVLGVGTGLALGISFASDGFFDFGSGDVVKATALLGLAGATAGGLIGSAIRTERWEEMPHGPAPVTIAPAAGGGVRLAFSVNLPR